GPFATGTTKFLHRTGRITDLAASVRTDNLSTLLRAGLGNQVLVRFLIREALQSQSDRLRTLRTFYPMASAEDWELIDAGIRVQGIKKSDRGRLYFGTEVVTTDDRSLAALLGASPGASVAAHIALEVIQRCFPHLLQSSYGYAQMKRMIPSLDLDLSDPNQARSYLERSAEIDQTLQLESPETTESR
ncbi:MAG TPA: malate:quinone oxidoreductase, partial [Opitutaceae bacterium]|nr:malate:quinone oxidoreductase [Opitutaceae bacterium]